MKSARDQLNILSAYAELGSYRAAAALCGTTHKTVRRTIERRDQGRLVRPPRPRNTDPLTGLITERVRSTDGRISAKRLLPVCRTAGYVGSVRNLRRAVAGAKAAWRRDRRTYRPWQPVPGEHLAIDWGTEGGLHVFCAVLAWSRFRFIRFAEREDQATTLRLLAECFETLGGVPAVVLADRMGCLKGGVVANVVVPAPGYVRFATHHGFRPDFCEAADPESKGVVEHLVGYAKTDLVVPGAPWAGVAAANTAAVTWCVEVNGRRHADIVAIPAERLAVERPLLRRLPSLRLAALPAASRKVDALSTVRFGSARYSMGRQDAPSGAPLLCSKRGVSPKGPPMIDRGRLDMLVTRTLQLDLDALPIRDRAAPRLLTRADTGTASQLARLIYRRERTAQERLLQLLRGRTQRNDPPPLRTRDSRLQDAHSGQQREGVTSDVDSDRPLEAGHHIAAWERSDEAASLDRKLLSSGRSGYPDGDGSTSGFDAKSRQMKVSPLSCALPDRPLITSPSRARTDPFGGTNSARPFIRRAE